MAQPNASQAASPARITVFPQRDSQGNIISATAMGTRGLQVGVVLPPFPDQNSITYTQSGSPDLVMTQQISQDTYAFNCTTGSKAFDFSFTSNGPFSRPVFVVTGGGAYPDAESLLTAWNQAFELFVKADFDDHFDFDFQQFQGVLTEASLQRSPSGVNPLLTLDQSGPPPAGVRDKSVWGSIAKGIIWGLAAVGAAAAVETLPLVFLIGASASALTDVVNAVDNSSDDGGGGGKAPPTSGQGNDQSSALKKDNPVKPPAN